MAEFKILFLLVILLLGIGAYNLMDNLKEEVYIDKYQGPVPIGYNEKHFRETGETVKEDINGN